MLMNRATEHATACTLADFTSPRLIAAHLRGKDLPSVVYELSEALESEGRVPDVLQFYHAALNREYLCSTALSHGVAFPHAQITGLPRLSFAFGRSSEPLVWGSGTSPTVQYVFLIAAPAGGSGPYLSLVSGLAHFARSELLHELSAATTQEAILAIFGKIRFAFHGVDCQSEQPVAVA